MASAGTPVVITDQDLCVHDVLGTEPNRTSNTSYPSAEPDCACGDNGFATPLIAADVFPESTYNLTPLHTERLDDEYTLAFNPLAPSGVAVLNTTAIALLESFRQPRRLREAVLLAGSSSNGMSIARRLVELGLIRAPGSSPRLRASTPQTLTAWLHVTNACNLRCDYCYIHKTPDAMELERGRQAVAAVFRSALAHGFRRVKVKYAGGEATLNLPLVLELHRYARRLAEEQKLGLDGIVLSNGVMLSDQAIDALQEHGIRLMISLDGVGAYHNLQRPFVNGRGSFAYVEQTLDRLAAHNFTPSVSITLTSRNLAGLPETVEYLLRRALPFTINFFRENDCAASFSDLAYRDEQIIAAMRAAFAIIEHRLPPQSMLGTLVDRARLDAPHELTCGAGHSYLVIDQHGGVAKCQMEIERTITDISVDDPLRLVRDDVIGFQNLPVDQKEGCRECNWRYWCAGGCPALTFRVTGRFDIKSPNCRIYTALFPDILRLEGLRLLKYGRHRLL